MGFVVIQVFILVNFVRPNFFHNECVIHLDAKMIFTLATIKHTYFDHKQLTSAPNLSHDSFFQSNLTDRDKTPDLCYVFFFLFRCRQS